MTRGSRTLNMPLPMKCLSLAGLTRNNFRNARWDHPSETFALMPSAPRRKRTARTDRLRRCAILLTGSYPAQSNNRASSSAVQGREAGRELRLAVSHGGGLLGGEHTCKAVAFEGLRSCRMRRQQSPRFHSGTSCRTLLIARCFPAGPSLNPVISTRSIAGRNRG